MKELVLLIGDCEGVKTSLLSSLEKEGFSIGKLGSNETILEVIKNEKNPRFALSLPLKGAKEAVLSCKESKEISLTSILLSGLKQCFLSSYKAKETSTLMQRTYPFVDAYLDIDGLSKEELKTIIVDHLVLQNKQRPLLVFTSFGYKFGVPSDAHFVFDCRGLPNPFWVPELRPLNGLDQPVIDFLKGKEEINSFLQETSEYLEKRFLTAKEKGSLCQLVYLGCTGGHHRSVYLAEELAKRFSTSYSVVKLHRDLKKGEML